MLELQPIFPNLSDQESLVIAGPCSAETREQTLATARELADYGIKIFRAGIWKPRTKPGGFEGVGAPALEWLKEVKETTGMLTSCEVATRAHVEQALEAGVDMLWIGARTSANPFAMQEIADTLKDSGKDVPVMVKNPVNPDLELWVGAVQRLYNAGIRRLGVIHRGFSVYGKHLYRNVPQWHIPIEMRLRFPNMPIVVDPSHIGGKRELIAPLSQQALDMGFNGLIIESHCDPDHAWSDAAQQLTPEVLNFILHTLVIRDEKETTENLSLLRQQIDRIDNELLETLARRMEVSREIGRYKKLHRMPVVQATRYNDVIATRVNAGKEMQMDPEFLKTILLAIHDESVRQQIEIINDRKS
ncbi:MAG: bifunctional 3-deoxy-7-phosphoheptulonate synthase/chorismate mutase type II [Muribaculaceae bacterium]|nr:bifunctional 3-deoxy-7-phosphoheptulonate synthase/chorismate mutase type II [Muribaculaceae bacterium]MDE6330397.1 bifunctional 3-deoxy-7-phosphoheptulonate synthase/chorismate mutase type II [Muribaculaceae bacterium]